jgi:hypothetical protein
MAEADRPLPKRLRLHSIAAGFSDEAQSNLASVSISPAISIPSQMGIIPVKL